MWKPGSISGHVTDASGSPVRGLMVVAMQVTEAGAERNVHDSHAGTHGCDGPVQIRESSVRPIHRMRVVHADDDSRFRS